MDYRAILLLACCSIATAADHIAVVGLNENAAYFAFESTNTATPITGLNFATGDRLYADEAPLVAIDGNYAILSGSDATTGLRAAYFANSVTSQAGPQITGLDPTNNVSNVDISGSNAVIVTQTTTGTTNNFLYFANVNTNAATIVPGWPSSSLIGSVSISGNNVLFENSQLPIAYFANVQSNLISPIAGLTFTTNGTINDLVFSGHVGVLGGADDSNVTTRNAVANFVDSNTNLATEITGLGPGVIEKVSLSEDGSVAILSGFDTSDNFVSYFATPTNPVATPITGLSSGGSTFTSQFSGMGTTIGITGIGDVNNQLNLTYFVNSKTNAATPIDLLGSLSNVAMLDDTAVIGTGTMSTSLGSGTDYVFFLKDSNTTASNPVLQIMFPPNLGDTIQPNINLDITRAPSATTPPDPLKGSFRTLAQAQFSLSSLLADHCILDRFLCTRSLLSNCCVPQTKKKWWRKSEPSNPNPCCKSPVSPWLGLLGTFSHQHPEESATLFDTLSGGAILGVDYCKCSQLFGGGVAYVYSYIDYKNGQGHAQVNQELAVLYTMLRAPGNFYLSAAAWGGPYQIRNEQHLTTALFSPTAVYHQRGWLLTPHVEIGYDYDRCCWSVEPFVMADWTLSWMRTYNDVGSGFYKRSFSSQFTSLLRAEGGFRFYEALQYCWGRLVLLEKISYVNEQPFHTGPISAKFSTTTYTVQTVPTKNLSLLAGEFGLWFLPANTKNPYGDISYQAEWNFTEGLKTRYWSQSLMLEIGLNF